MIKLYRCAGCGIIFEDGMQTYSIESYGVSTYNPFDVIQPTTIYMCSEVCRKKIVSTVKNKLKQKFPERLKPEGEK